MGIFGGIGKALKGIDWGNVSAGLQSAGAMAHGDYGTAAQIQGLRRQRMDDRAQQDAQAQQHEQLVQAAVQAGIPEQQARALPPQTLATALAQRIQPQGEEWTYFDDNAGNRWRQNSRTGAVDPNPTFVDRNPRQFLQDGQLVTVPNSYAGPQAAPQGGPQPGSVVGGFRFKGGNPNDRNSWEPAGGGAGNSAGNFPGFQRLGGGQFRFP
jgi:hypothetical protein